MNLVSMPPEIIGAIMAQLNVVTGSQGIVNKADIPVVMKYVANLACTCRTLAEKVNNVHATKIFLNSLSEKYGKSCERLAVMLNTPVARMWLWEQIQQNGDAKSYQVIQSIYDLTAAVLVEAKEKGFHCKMKEARIDWPTPSPNNCQTRQGFVLYLEGYPDGIGTPFGWVKLYSYGSTDVASENFVIGTIMKRLKCVLHKEAGVYKIQEVNSEMMPPVLWHEKHAHTKRSYDLIMRIWDMLEAHRLGRDPVEKIAQPIVSLPVCPLQLDSILQIPQWGIEVVEKVAAQPLVFLKEEIHGLQRRLEFNSDLARLLEVVNGASRQFLTKNTCWSLHSSDFGIEFWGYNERNPCSLQILKEAYESVIQLVGKNWVRASLRDHSDILFTQSEEEYILFVKPEEAFVGEAGFIVLATNVLGLSGKVHCSNDYKGERSSGLYMWIEKAHVDKALRAFNIEE